MIKIDSKRAAAFLYTLAALGALWGAVGFYLIHRIFNREGASAFLQVYFFTCLDLVALIMIFWKLFYSKMVNLGKKIDLFLWFVFKLVCLGFLAITLKRLTNAPIAAILLGVSFIGVGPLVAGLLCKRIGRDRI